MKLPIYLDHHATTPVDPRVLEAMLPTFTTVFGNAASKTHSFGWQAAEAVDRARAEVATLIGAQPKEIVFTSGATESNNLAIQGAAEHFRERGDHVISVATEHSSVLDVLKVLEANGLRITLLPVDAAGLVDPAAVRAAITDRTILITVMAANNEIGTLAPMAELGRIARERGVLFHTDATQAIGKVPVNVEEWGVGLLSLSAHKLYGPKGAGALYVRSQNPRARIQPQMHGGGHERGLRSGTVNVPGAVGLGRACAIAREEMEAEARRVQGLRDRLERGLMERLEGVTRNGPPGRRLPGNANLAFAGVEGEALMMGIKEIAVSSGSACTSANPEPSHVLKAIGVRPELSRSSIRFGLGRWTTGEEIDFTIERVATVVTKLRQLSPVRAPAGRGA